MDTLYQVLAIIAAIALTWFLYRAFKNNPEMFSAENFTKSFGSMGILALILIAFVSFCVILLRST